jgi:hypothetical protein
MTFVRDTKMSEVLATDVATTLIPVPLNLNGETPKVIWVIGMNRASTSSSGVTAGDLVFSRGFAVSTTRRYAMAVTSDHAAATSNTGGILKDDCILTGLDPATGLSTGRLDLNSVGADAAEFVVNQQFGVDMVFYVHALSGSDITGAAIVQWTKQATTGDQDITGFGFTPKFLDTMSNGHTALNVVVGWRVMFGLATTSPAANGVLSLVSLDNVATSDTTSYCNDAEGVVLNQNTTTIAARGSVTAGIADGVRVNWAENAAGAQIFVSLALAGSFQCAVGSFLSEDDTTTEIESAVGFPYEFALLHSHGQAESTLDTLQNHARASFGFAHGPLEASLTPQQGAMAFIDVDNLADTAISGVLLDIDAAAEADYINISTAGAIDGIAQMFASATPPANSLVHKMTNADPIPSLVLFAAFGAAPAAAADDGLGLMSLGAARKRRGVFLHGSEIAGKKFAIYD